MPAYARKKIVNEKKPGLYHCVSQCTPRAFLCGVDNRTGRSFDHRKEWIRERLETLSKDFGVEVQGFAVTRNHLHVVLRTRPDLVSKWSNTELTERWQRIFPPKIKETESTDSKAVKTIAPMNRARLAEVRRRIASLSWFMRCLAEPIARRSNREDGRKGHFWEGRFKSREIGPGETEPILNSIKPTTSTAGFSRHSQAAKTKGKPKGTAAATRRTAARPAPKKTAPKKTAAKAAAPKVKKQTPTKTADRRATPKAAAPTTRSRKQTPTKTAGRKAAPKAVAAKPKAKKQTPAKRGPKK